MTRAGRILGVMMANRERYEDWLDHVWGVPKRGSSQQRQPVMRAAEAKRARKAAKRRRDAALMALGRERAYADVVVGDLWYLEVVEQRMDDIRRGEVQP